MLRCTQSDRGPHLFYSPQRLIQRHERYVRSLGARFESRCYILLLLFLSFFFVVRDAHLGDITVIVCRSCEIVEVVSVAIQTLVFITLVNEAKKCKTTTLPDYLHKHNIVMK